MTLQQLKIKWNSDTPDPASSSAPYRIYNIGNNNPVNLSEYIDALENALGKSAKKEFLPIQDGDVPDTFANIDSLVKDFGFKPLVNVEEGIAKFAEWFRSITITDNSCCKDRYTHAITLPTLYYQTQIC